MKNTGTKDLTVGSPFRLIIGFMGPLLFGLVFQQFYNMADTMIVGRFLGLQALSGVGSTGAINFLVLGFCTGICAGFTIPVAQRFGEKNYEDMRRFIGNILWLSLLFAVVITFFTAVFCADILRAMDTPEEVFKEAYDYIFVIFLGIPAIMLYNVLFGLIRALGNSRTPVLFLIFASILNVVLDLFAILVLKLGVTGAGLATVFSQLISGLLCLFYIIRRCPLLHISRSDLKIRKSCMSRLCIMGLPMGLQYSVTAVGSILLQTSVNRLGTVYIGASAAASKVFQLFCCPMDAMGTTMATYGAQNTGARQISRIRSGVRAALLIGTVYCAVAFAVIHFFGRPLASLFLESGENQTAVLDASQQYLTINTIFFLFLLCVYVFRFVVQGIGFAAPATFAGLFEMVARGIIGVQFVPLFGYVAACYAGPLAWIMADVFLIPIYFYGVRILKRRFEAYAANKAG